MGRPNLPPWGLMEVELLGEITNGLIPKDWRPANGSAPDPVNWQQWRDPIIARIERILFPGYVPGGASWNTPAVARLFDTDFELFQQLQPRFDLPIDAAFATTVTHSEFFFQEDDDNTDFGTGYERYDPQLSAALRQQLIQSMRHGITDKVASLDLQMKLVFQRPRAYQVAVIQNRGGYLHHRARSANTPSMVSGHCLESSLAGCKAFEDLSASLSQKSTRLLKQFTVDIGDRRVFAGVHYPSDNLSSWFTALHLVPRTFGRLIAGTIKDFLWDAISTHSHVFRAIEGHARKHRDSPYRQAVKALRDLGKATV